MDYILSGEKQNNHRAGQRDSRAQSSRRKNPRARRWRGLSPASRSRFAQAWKDLHGQCEVEIRRVLGHAGDPLNQAADQIAYMGLRAIAHPLKQSRPTLKHGINKALAKAASDTVESVES